MPAVFFRGSRAPLVLRVIVPVSLATGSAVIAFAPSAAAATVSTGFSAIWDGSPAPSSLYSYGILNAGGDNWDGGGDCSYGGANNVADLGPGGEALIDNGEELAPYWFLTGPDYPAEYDGDGSCADQSPSAWGTQQAKWFIDAINDAGFGPSEIQHTLPFGDALGEGAF